MSASGEWHPDLLGQGWQARTLRLAPDAEGPAVATLVRMTPDAATDPGRRAVLYVHGFVDYFFQTHLGRFWADAGYRFYAIDLRGYGRSLLAHQTPNYCTDLAVHDEELDEAMRILREEEGCTEVVAMGHSTGGLVVPLWAARRQHDAPGFGPDAMVLNSPWFDLNGSRLERTVATWAVDVVGRVLPRLRVGSLAQHYGRWLHSGTGGEWDYDLTWKPHQGFPVRAGWMRTVRRGHRAVAEGLGLRCPVLVCAAERSGPDDRWHADIGRTDSVLDVTDIVTRAVRLGPDVTVVQIPDGVHDLTLSAQPARDRFFAAIRDWLP